MQQNIEKKVFRFERSRHSDGDFASILDAFTC